MAGKQRRNSRTKNGIKISEVGSRRQLEVDFTVRVAGERFRFRRFSPFDTRARTQEWAEAERAAILERAGRPQPSSTRLADPTAPRTVQYWADRWLQDASNPARRDGPNRRASVASKEAILRVHLTPFFGRRVITKLDEDRIDEYVEAKVGEAALAKTTVALHLRYLRAVLNFAKRKGSPAERALELPPNISLRRPERSRIPATLSEKQTNALLASLHDAPRLQAFTTILFRQGCRVGEVQSLRWSDIDLEQETINIARSWDREEFGKTKGGRPRLGPLHPDVRAALERLPAGDPWSLLFASRSDPSRPADRQNLLDQLRKYAAELDLRDENGDPIHLTTKVGRHSLGRQWGERGLPLRSLQDILGHASLDVTQVYMYWSSAESAQHLRQIGSGRQPSLEEIVRRLRRVGVDGEVLARAGLVDVDTPAASTVRRGDAAVSNNATLG